MNSGNNFQTYLITGGAGFIGSHLVRRVCRAGHRVINLDKLTYAGNLENICDVADRPGYRLVKGDIADHDLVRRLIMQEKPDTIFHLAAESHVDRSIDSPSDFIQTNLVGTFALLEGAREAWHTYAPEKKSRFRFIHVSTDEVFGQLGPDGSFREDSPYDPSSPYSASKAGSDHLARAWLRTYGLPVIVTNCSNNYGPYQHAEKLIPSIIRSALAGIPIPIYGRGKNVRDWIYVGDHVDGLIKAADAGAPGATYLFGSGAEQNNDALCGMVCEALDAAFPANDGRRYIEQIRHVEDRPGHDFRYAIDPARTCAALGWKADTSLNEGLRRTVDWYLCHPKWLVQTSISNRQGDRDSLVER